jgi:superfamily I DNA and RNA helicase
VVPGVRIQHFHELCYELGQEANIPLPRREDAQPVDQAYFTEVLPSALARAAELLEARFDAIIVDEGQDFEGDWLSTLGQLLRDPDEGIFYIFYDESQNLYNRNPRFPAWPTFKLTRNVRNTDPIHQVVAQYHDGKEPFFAGGVSGPAPMFVPTDEHPDEAAAVGFAIETLVSQGVPHDWIAVLCPRSKANSRWQPETTHWASFRPTWSLEARDGRITCSTIYSFKGLERPAIIVTELDQLPVDPVRRQRLLYTACSRAKTHLVIVGDRALMERFPPVCDQRQLKIPNGGG